jgi:hypothetical protein
MDGENLIFKKSIYIESTIPSYATARETANALNVIRQAQRKVQGYNDEHGLWTPALVTPETIYCITENDNDKL